MAKELEIVFRNNKLTPWGRTLEFLTTDQIPTEVPVEFQIFFLKCFLLENYAFLKSLHDHVQRFQEVRDESVWYEKTKPMSKGELVNHAFSVYLHALRTAIESVRSSATRGRYLELYRDALRRGKTAKALHPKIKPSLGMMEDLDLIISRKAHDNRIALSKKNNHTPYRELMECLPNYNVLVSSMNDKLINTLFEAYGYTRDKALSAREIISNVEDLFTQLSDPVFKVCDMNTLIDVAVIQAGLNGYRLMESSVREIVIEESSKAPRKYQILPDRHGKKRFFKIRI